MKIIINLALLGIILIFLINWAAHYYVRKEEEYMKGNKLSYRANMILMIIRIGVVILGTILISLHFATRTNAETTSCERCMDFVVFEEYPTIMYKDTPEWVQDLNPLERWRIESQGFRYDSYYSRCDRCMDFKKFEEEPYIMYIPFESGDDDENPIENWETNKYGGPG